MSTVPESPLLPVLLSLIFYTIPKQFINHIFIMLFVKSPSTKHSEIWQEIELPLIEYLIDVSIIRFNSTVFLNRTEDKGVRKTLYYIIIIIRG